jgi:hypothetical protein
VLRRSIPADGSPAGTTLVWTFSSPQANLVLSGPNVLNNGSPVAITPNPDGTFTSEFRAIAPAPPPGQTSASVTYILFAGNVSCPVPPGPPSLTVVSGTGPTSTPTATFPPGVFTPTPTATFASATLTPTSTPVPP